MGQRRLVKMATRAINRVNTPQIKSVFNRRPPVSLCGDPATRLEMNLMALNSVCLRCFFLKFIIMPASSTRACFIGLFKSELTAIKRGAGVGHKSRAGLIRCQPCHINYAGNESTLQHERLIFNV